jgi:dTDP-4-amino-4,6-dideoxygalactose transaminase
MTPYRDELRDFLLKNGIATAIHYPIPPHMQKCYSSLNKNHYPIAEKISKQALSLPISPLLTNEDVDYISDKINCFRFR